MTRRAVAAVAWCAAVVLLAGCTGGEGASTSSSPDGDLATIDPFPTAESEAPSPDVSPGASPSASSSDAGAGGVVVTFTRGEALNPLDREAARTGGIPAVLREPDAAAGDVTTSTTLTCREARQETVDVPIPRDGLLRLRASVRVVARLSGDSAYTVLALDSDRAILLGLDRRGRVRSRASANQIDERWFVREVEDCR